MGGIHQRFLVGHPEYVYKKGSRMTFKRDLDFEIRMKEQRRLSDKSSIETTTYRLVPAADRLIKDLESRR